MHHFILAALATLAATGAAFAQSTATLYGVVDTGYRSVTSGTNKFNGMANGSNASNRLGFKGTEDLGGGLSASFVMEGDLAPNDGTASGFKFLRQSTVGVTGGFGEVRLGRDYTPAFRVYGVVDPFGTVGVGSAGNIGWSTVVSVPALQGPTGNNAVVATHPNQVAISQIINAGTGTFSTANRGTGVQVRVANGGGGATVLNVSTPSAKSAAILPPTVTIADPNVVRANNSFAYYSPKFMDVSGSLMYSAGTQNTASEKAQGQMTGLSLNYANGPLVLAYANQVTKGGFTGALPTGGAAAQSATLGYLEGVAATDNQKFTTSFLVASYDFGMVKLGLGNRTEKLTAAGTDLATKTSSMIYGLTAPVGAITLKASYITKKASTELGALEATVKAGNQLAMGAVYDLSKRTAVYATYAVLKNEAGFANSVGSAAASADGVKSKGFDLGVRHSF